ncbi:copper resistance CopC family protein [Frankia nepalensis]|uniref:Copper resistance protein CopC n=1 Tax=Frankia nepalensis TaxID=1836974 RepID=A0A937RHR4_9ACTN|nr:copper resistance CopC family protein [Frankia nepalensis]MBL7499356.1 copper resistance protein CopC [Frankia nepalensis]MBL7514114.1 copper resistance protein CopC [Frankia nepalensis]MBL7632463.1 copper resistance protein CopC [Frankia nepalensis]
MRGQVAGWWPRAAGRAAAGALVGALAVLATLTVGVAPASAHTSLASSTPAAGSTVPTVPDQVELVFTQRLLGVGVVTVLGPGDVTVSTGAPVQDGARVTQALAAERPAGAYRIAYRVVAADGHTVTGEVAFTATAGTGPASPTPTATATTSAAPVPTSAPSGPTTGATALTNEGGGSDDGGSSTGLVVGVAVGAVGLIAIAGAATAIAARRRREHTDGT